MAFELIINWLANFNSCYNNRLTDMWHLSITNETYIITKCLNSSHVTVHTDDDDYYCRWRLSVSIFTWLKHRQTSICMSKHQLALLGRVPSEQTDVRQEGVGFFVHCEPDFRVSIGPDIQRTSLGDKRHSVSWVPAPAHRCRDSCKKQTTHCEISETGWGCSSGPILPNAGHPSTFSVVQSCHSLLFCYVPNDEQVVSRGRCK